MAKHIGLFASKLVYRVGVKCRTFSWGQGQNHGKAKVMGRVFRKNA